MPAPVVDAGVHDDPVHPRGQLRVLPEPVERAIDLDEDFLRDVFRIVVVAGELIGDAIHHRSMPLDERLKRGCVAARRAGNQVGISHSAAAEPGQSLLGMRVPASDGWSFFSGGSPAGPPDTLPPPREALRRDLAEGLAKAGARGAPKPRSARVARSRVRSRD